MNLNDITGIGKVLPIDKLVEAISSGIGRITKHYWDKKDIETEVIRLKALSRAKVEAHLEARQMLKDADVKDVEVWNAKTFDEITNAKIVSPVAEIDLTLDMRTSDRFYFQEKQKQNNLEGITNIASEQLVGEPEVDNVPIEKEWITRFINIAQEVSTEELQQLWGRILAGEVKQPGTFSLRTLELIRNLSSDEARLIEKVGKLAFNMFAQNALFRGRGDILSSYLISFKDISLLIEIGILQAGHDTIFRVHDYPGRRVPLFYGNYYMMIEQLDQPSELQLPVYLFTTAGMKS